MNEEINSLNLWNLGCKTSPFPNNPKNPILCRQQYAQAQGINDENSKPGGIPFPLAASGAGVSMWLILSFKK